VGITNQRETTVAWNDRTGKVYYNAIVWDDTRTAAVAECIVRENDNGSDALREKPQDVLREKTGLPVASYFAGTKVRWLVDSIKELKVDLDSPLERKNVRFGTIDVWLVYMLSGYTRSIAEEECGCRLANEGGVFKTDVSNASRWLFMDLDTLDWDADLIKKVVGDKCDFPIESLPKIVPSSDCTIGVIRGVGETMTLKDVPITAILGDQQAALFGQACFQPGEAKCTYGTGLFLMMNTGTEKVPSTNGLLTTVAYQLGQRTTSEDATDKQPIYSLEGSVAFSGSTIQWLRDRLEIISSASETEALALSVPSSQGMYLVPAFSGLFAPHWQADARGCMVGLTASHSKAHIVRSALESSAYQVSSNSDCRMYKKIFRGNMLNDTYSYEYLHSRHGKCLIAWLQIPKSN
jgi:glycerol kinase